MPVVFNIGGPELVGFLLSIVFFLLMVYLAVRVARFAWKGREPKRRL
jgi:hypothetical protein